MIGGLIYLLFRNNGLLMFSWFGHLGLTPIIQSLRYSTLELKQFLPKWVVYSVPDFLWTYSLTAFMVIVWNNKLSSNNFFWILAAPLISIIFELGQLFGFIRGTFDLTDLLFILLAAYIPLKNISITKTSFKHYEQNNMVTY